MPARSVVTGWPSATDMRFSPSTLGWYPTFIQYADIPEDVIEVSDELYSALIGKQIQAGEDGMPVEVTALPPGPPLSVTMRQARLALLHAEKLGMVEVAIASLPSPEREAAQIDWEFAATVDRESATTALLAQAIGMGSDELDQLFMLAATL